MKDKKEKKKNARSQNLDVERRQFIEKSAKDIGACGFAIWELAKTIREEVVQGVKASIEIALEGSVNYLSERERNKLNTKEAKK